MTLAMLDDVVAFGYDRASLDAIARPAAALAIWWRSLPDALRTALAALDLATVDDVSLDLDAGAPLDATLRAAGYPDAVAALLAADIGLLVRRHAALTGEDRLRIRLDVVETDACRRFHADFVTLRLLCSYVGPGTQWCRARAPDAICEVPTGAVGVFKGRMLLDPPSVLHRSPPIVATGDRRLLLVIDPLRGPDLP
ncbi:DUF1826 domain-containing protein [Sphingomonas sp. 2R-10]|uniref:DUF1826 domain-containing protein n=1 Tax=Sphingomonas sp. 2R-10 TaxID=3045148 RepID=UPI000F76EB69|nr:DUF1826 domain-containing protein [Sphingomonas sp. 2R-10]MDJ0275904.1 DUF1826 domain-containing protein [Sphingomonas sp. 2R-10]